MTNLNKIYDTGVPFDGHDLREMFLLVARLFECHVDSINALNVFPVPDGDTGINMFITLRAVAKHAESTKSDSAGDVAGVMAKGALFEARGNSGVILCQFFEGIARGLSGRRKFTSSEFALALKFAADHAYGAVSEPVEGTMLTVINNVAAAAQESVNSGGGMLELLGSTWHTAIETVAMTPTMLPVLQQAGVVDAGGQGIAVIFQALNMYVNRGGVPSRDIQVAGPDGALIERGMVSADFLKSINDENYGYCTQFLLHGQDLDPKVVRDKVNSMAESTVVVGDKTMLKIHVHVHDPGPIISLAVSMGTLSQIKIDNMDQQHDEFSNARKMDRDDIEDTGTVTSIAVVAVVNGDGLENVFRDLGAEQVLLGGDTMNPSVKEILDSIEDVSSDTVIILPNNRNIIAGAQKASALSDKSVFVILSTTIPQGISAMLAFNPEKISEDNVREMQQASGSVRTGEICKAMRPVKLDGVVVQGNQIIGLLNRKLVVAGDAPSPVLLELLKSADVREDDLVTLYYGRSVTSHEAEDVAQQVTGLFSGVELEVIYGGQQHYHYIVSIE